MSAKRSIAALFLSMAVLFNCAPLAIACGPDAVQPIFVFKASPDPPFEDFTRGKLGIVMPSMGRKTLIIAYRYLNGGSFTGEEQRALVEALRGTAPEDKGEDAIKAWIEARKEAGDKDQALPAIYAERQYGGYDFFPNCTRSGFETATETLKDRIGSHGIEDPHVRSWVTGQDAVFQNCAGGSNIPQELGLDSPEWLRKDRDYQIAAAYFYSLNFEKARESFERIAADNESPWRQTADYLVARTLVRQASLTNDPMAKRAIYAQAERHLQLLIGSGGKFLNASQKLLALISYRLHPEERVVELGRVLAYQNSNDNLRQDLIDYVWLLDKFTAEVAKAEEKRKVALKGDKEKDDVSPGTDRYATFKAIEAGELIEIYFGPKNAKGEVDYEKYRSLVFKPDISEEEVLQSFEEAIGRRLTPDDISEIKKGLLSALERRQWYLAPNMKLSKIDESQYEGDYYYGDDREKPALDLFPAFLRADELSDWIITFQGTDANAFSHALARWRETESTGWLLAALDKAEASTPQVEKLMDQSEKVTRDSAAYPTIAYHLIRLKIAQRKTAEARQLLEDIFSKQYDLLSVSAQNQFRELGMQLAVTLSDFLRFGQRTPAAFYKFGRFGTISDILKIEKAQWDPEFIKQTKEEFEQEFDELYKDLLYLEGRFAFDEKTVEVFNTHFSLAVLAEAARNPALPDHLQTRMLLAAWTRAILLRNEKIARKVTSEIIELAPHLKSILEPYLDARTVGERENAALYIILRAPVLSPYVGAGVSAFLGAEHINYYFETSWWCTPSDTEYDLSGNEVKKIIEKPLFLSPEQLVAARREHTALVEIGNAKSYLGKRVIAWAKRSPGDVRVPEALYIAVEANKSYKYGCGSWEEDEDIVKEASSMLRNRYPDSGWTAKLDKPE